MSDENNSKINGTQDKPSLQIEELNMEYGKLAATYGDNSLKQVMLQQQFEELQKANKKVQEDVIALLAKIRSAATVQAVKKEVEKAAK